MFNQAISSTRAILLGGFLASGIVVLAGAQAVAPSAQSAISAKLGTVSKQSPVASTKPVVDGKPIRYHPNRFSKRAELHYGLIWGVNSLAAKWTESGEVIKFTYHVLDATKAKALNDKKNEPSLIDPQAGVSLVVPSLEKVGQLRQSSIPEVGKTYWMAFSNKGRLVKRGDHVNVVIGHFRAEGLVVD